MDEFHWRDIPTGFVILFVCGLLIGIAILGWYTILGPLFNRADANNYNTSPQHLQAVAQFLTDECQARALAKDAQAKQAIEQDIYQSASTVDIRTLQLSDGVRLCVTQSISDVMGGH